MDLQRGGKIIGGGVSRGQDMQFSALPARAYFFFFEGLGLGGLGGDHLSPALEKAALVTKSDDLCMPTAVAASVSKSGPVQFLDPIWG